MYRNTILTEFSNNMACIKNIEGMTHRHGHIISRMSSSNAAKLRSMIEDGIVINTLKIKNL